MKNFFPLVIYILSTGIGVILTGTRELPTTRAESTVGQDCTSFTRVPQNSYQYFSSIYPQKLLEVAQNNLWNYCCKYESKVIPKEMMDYCTDHATEDYVKSPWLFDQLVDVGFRYLDGVESLQYENAPLDAKGKERREKIEALGINIQGAIPLVILNEYKTYRGDRTQDMDIVASQTQSCLESTQRFTDYNQNRDSIPLSKKYFIICEISSCLSSDEKNKFLTSCQNLAKQRIFHEDDFTQGVILVQANQAMTTSFNAYANGYLTNTRMNQFLEKTVLMTKGFQFIDSKVPQLTRICSG